MILAAGCVGTTELLLRCKQEGSIPGLSERVGYGFSTNGDCIAFLPGTRYKVSLTRGPVTTSFAHFNTPDAGPNGDAEKFHTIEDQGIPRALASLIGHGVPLLRSLSKGRRRRLFIAYAVGRYALSRIPAYIRAFRNAQTRQDQFVSEDEWTMDMMCAVGMGRDKALGRFRLGSGWRDTRLRLQRTDGIEFYNDPIYTEIEATLARFAKELSDDPQPQFQNPFLGPGAELAGGRSVTLTHPLGGCVMADSAEGGVVDALGHVFDTTSGGVRPDLYIADGSAIPTALGVNPSVTISAVALRTAHHIVEEMRTADEVRAPAEATSSTRRPSQHRA